MLDAVVLVDLGCRMARAAGVSKELGQRVADLLVDAGARIVGVTRCVMVNATGPGVFLTVLMGPAFAAADRTAPDAAPTSLGRSGALEHIDGTLLFLCSVTPRFVTGLLWMGEGEDIAK